MGRKNKYETHVKSRLADIAEMIQLLNEDQIAKQLGISRRSFENYKNEHEELREALKGGREELCGKLKVTLKQKAMGFKYTERKTTLREDNGKKVKVIEEFERYAPPDLGAIHLLLKNLDADWVNDDRTTLEMKRKQLELTEKRIDQSEW